MRGRVEVEVEVEASPGEPGLAFFRENRMAGRLDDIQLLVASGRSSAYRIGTELADVEKALETTAATWHLTTIDVCYSQVAVSIVGMFSLYESRLQSIYRWAKPLDEVQRLLESNRGTNQAEEFENFKLAVNVLKHGRGASHSKLSFRAPAIQSTKLLRRTPRGRRLRPSVRPHFGVNAAARALLWCN